MTKLYRDDAIVLRTHPLGEADRIITLLTRRHGKVRAVAKGVRRTGSRFGARLEPFTLVDAQLHAGRSLHTVTQVVTIETFAQPISADYARFTAASAMFETTDRLTDEVVDPHQGGFLMLVGALRAMAGSRIADPGTGLVPAAHPGCLRLGARAAGLCELRCARPPSRPGHPRRRTGVHLLPAARGDRRAPSGHRAHDLPARRGLGQCGSR